MSDAAPEAWPALPLDEWQSTYATLHMWTQIVGKTRLALAPPVNHWWHSALYVTPRGLTTSAMPCGERSCEVQFDFLAHTLVLSTSDGETATLPLVPRSVAAFYHEYTALLRELEIEAAIWPVPVEVEHTIRFTDDTVHASYDADAAQRCWRVLLHAGRVMQAFRGRFIGKSSPAHFFWGSFDLAVTRFSGRRAPPRDGADAITREAYSHEVISAGFWPGSGTMREAAFYAYAAPEPAGFADAAVRPASAYYSRELTEFILPYEAVRTAVDPDAALLDFLQSSYEAGAELAGWDRAALERA